MLSAITQFRMNVPLVNVLSKIDIVAAEALDTILRWGKNPEQLYQEVIVTSPNLYHQLSEGIMAVINEMEALTALLPISNETLEGMEDLYTTIQHIFMGGEDLERE